MGKSLPDDAEGPYGSGGGSTESTEQRTGN